MASAVAITTRRLGSQAPNTSRKASTLAGCIMPEIRSPQPNTKPQTNPASTSISASQPVANDSHHDHCNAYKDHRRHQRARREPRHAADAMTGGAAAAKARAEADQQARDDDHGPACRHLRLDERVADEGSGQRSQDQADDEGNAPVAIGDVPADHPAEDAADSGNAAGREHQERGRKADQRTADGGG